MSILNADTVLHEPSLNLYSEANHTWHFSVTGQYLLRFYCSARAQDITSTTLSEFFWNKYLACQSPDGF